MYIIDKIDENMYVQIEVIYTHTIMQGNVNKKGDYDLKVNLRKICMRIFFLLFIAVAIITTPTFIHFYIRHSPFWEIVITFCPQTLQIIPTLLVLTVSSNTVNDVGSQTIFLTLQNILRTAHDKSVSILVS